MLGFLVFKILPFFDKGSLELLMLSPSGLLARRALAAVPGLGIPVEYFDRTNAHRRLFARWRCRTAHDYVAALHRLGQHVDDGEEREQHDGHHAVEKWPILFDRSRGGRLRAQRQNRECACDDQRWKKEGPVFHRCIAPLNQSFGHASVKTKARTRAIVLKLRRSGMSIETAH